MFSFFRKEKSLEWIFIETLKNSDIEWEIYSDPRYPWRWYKISWWSFIFSRSWDSCFHDWREISCSLLERIKEIAESSIILKDIRKAWGYIIDNDLRNWINDAKKIMVVGEQIEMLTNIINKIRDKYH